MRRSARTRFREASLIILLVIASTARPSDAPLSRHALENWSPDHHEVQVFHRGKLTLPQHETVELLRRFTPGDDRPSNIDVTLSDLDGKPDAAAVALYAELGKPELPWIVVRGKNLDRQTVLTFSGALNEESVRGIVESPARLKLAKRLAAGTIGVWVILESGNPEKDEQVRELLRKEHGQLMESLNLPDGRLPPKGPASVISLSYLPVKRDDPGEAFLRGMLLKSKQGIEVSKEPMVFPVFGRGRCLPPMIGESITAENITRDCKLLLGSSSGKNKSQSPGFDLLLSADWEAISRPMPIPESPPSTAGKKEPITIPVIPPGDPERATGPATDQAEKREGRFLKPLVYGGIILASLLVLFAGIRLFRSSASA